MTTFSLHLLRKTERIEASPEGFKHKLTFDAHLPPRERLTSRAGEEVAQGYVELTTNQPRFDAPTLMFAPATRDPDTGKTFPPSISFYAMVPETVFTALLNAPPAAKYTLNLSTELMGAIRFNDPLGLEKVWDTQEQNPMTVQYFDFAVAHDGDA